MKTYLEDTRHGRFLLIWGDFICDHIHQFGEWSETEVELFNSLLRSESNVVEIGANIGAHTIPLSRRCEKGVLIAFEVQRPIFYVLGANLAMNNRLNVIAKLAAAWDQDATLVVETCSYDDPWNYGNFSIEHGFSEENRFSGNRSTDHIPARRLDDDLHIRSLSAIDLLKIDVEGAEMRVLKGAERLIKTHKPFVYVEVTRKDVTTAFRHELEALGYEGYWFASVRGRPDSYFGPANYSHRYARGMDVNAIFIPRDRSWRPENLWPIGESCKPPADLPVLHKYPWPQGEPPKFTYGVPTRRRGQND